MDHAKLSDEVRAGGTVTLTGPMRDQHRDAHKIANFVPGAVIRHRDPVTGTPAYSEMRTAATVTLIFLPPPPNGTASMGAITPSR